MLTDGTGTILTTYEYDAFGREWDALDTDNNPFRYCGEYFDKQTKTIYLRARYYDSAYGRFTQQDGWQYADANDPLSLNLYTYCWNNPVNMVDPDGTSALLVSLIILGIGFIADIISGSASKRANEMIENPNWYNIGNWLTLGTFDMVKGTFLPDEPFSLEHWLNSFGTATLVLGGYQFVSNYRTKTPNCNVDDSIIIAGKGSTGRVLPNSLNEKLAMEQVLSDPLDGAKHLDNILLNDLRWNSSDGWIKMERIITFSDDTKATIHFVYNTITGMFDDFKYVN